MVAGTAAGAARVPVSGWRPLSAGGERGWPSAACSACAGVSCVLAMKKQNKRHDASSRHRLPQQGASHDTLIDPLLSPCKVEPLGIAATSISQAELFARINRHNFLLVLKNL